MEKQVEYKLSPSALSCYLQCPQKFYYEKIKRRVPAETSKSLVVGKAVHAGLEFYLKNLKTEDEFDKFVEAIQTAAINSLPNDSTQEAKIKVSVMLEQYVSNYWSCDKTCFEVLEVESWFEKPLLDKDFKMYGVVDAVVREITTGNVYIMEHKTASVVDDYYIEHIEIDSQVASYVFGLRDKYEIKGIIYDILQKPKTSMKLGETNAEYEARKAASKTGKIKRKETENPDEYTQRLREDLADTYKRIPLPINWDNGTNADVFGRVQYADGFADIVFQAVQIRDSIRNGIFPKQTCNCRSQYGVCPYLKVCTRRDTLSSENFIDYENTKQEVSHEQQ